jgi:hypothetical protein
LFVEHNWEIIIGPILNEISASAVLEMKLFSVDDIFAE